jgi:protoheme IX farnesyltransferase
VARLQLLVWSVLLVPVTLMPSLLGIAGTTYLLLAACLGAGFLTLSFYNLREDVGRRWARRVFSGSIVYLAVLFGALISGA